MTRLALITTLVVATLTTAALAQTPAEHDGHHPSETAKSAPAPTDQRPSASPPAGEAPQGGGMPMMGMMNDMKNMMSSMSMMNAMGMMQNMQMMGAGMDGMATVDRVEGRVAFLRTELKITEAQAGIWNAFADALRTNANKLGAVRSSIMRTSGAAQTLAQRLDQQEQWLLARLEGTRTIKSAFAKLNDTLSEDQRKVASDLMAPHMGMAAMTMMPPQMPPGQMGTGGMQQNQMRPGQMQGPRSRN